jgi:hypothetical protein
MKNIKAKLYGKFPAGVMAFTGAALAALILSACTFALDPVNAITDAFRFADTNVGILKVVNGSTKGAVLYGVRVIMPDKSLTEYNFESGLLPGNSREYRLPAQISYNVKFSNGKGWTKTPQAVYFAKDETFTVTFTGDEEISIDLSGAKGKLTVYNSIPPLPDGGGEYVIENLRIASIEGTPERENIVFYFYTANGIHNGEKPDFDVLPGDYWVRAQIRNPQTGKLSKWSIPAHVGSYSSTDKDAFDVSAEPARITISADRGGIAVFNEKVLKNGQPGGDVLIETPGFPSIPDNNLLDENGEETPNVGGKIDPDSKPVKAIRVEKLGFPTADRNGVTVEPKYTYAQKDTAAQEGKVVKTTIHEQDIAAGGEWHLALAESGWYLLSFSTDGKTFSKAFPIRLEDKNGNGKIEPGEVEPGVIPPYNNDNSTWTEKQGVIVSNDTPAEGGDIIDKNGNKIGELSSADAQKPITDIKVYNLDGSLYGHYRNQYGLPIYNGKEWVISPALPPGDYLVSLSDDNGSTWTYPPFLFHVDGNGDGSVNYDKTHPFWDGKTTGKPGPEFTSPTDPKWKGDGSNWRPDIEIDPKTPIYVVVPSEPPLDTVPSGTGPRELQKLPDNGNYDDMPSVSGSQLDIIHLETSDFTRINFIKLNSFSIPAKAYRIIDLTWITYDWKNDGSFTIGGIPKGRRLSLVGFDFKPGLYYVYLSENGRVWSKYKTAVNIPAPWTTDGTGKVVPAGEVEKVVYKLPNDTNWDIPSNIDTDNDGFPDDWEKEYGYDPDNPADPAPNGDDDGDGLTNKEEYDKGTDPKNPDTDDDGYNDKDDPDPLNPNIPGGTIPGDNGGTGSGDDGGNDGGGINVPDKGFLVVQNLTTSPLVNITSLTIKKSDGSFLVHNNTTYTSLPINIVPGSFDLWDIPVTSPPDSTATPYKVTLTAGSTVWNYTVSIWHNRYTYVKFRNAKPDGNEARPDPENSTGETGGGGTVPGDGGDDGGKGGGNEPPPDDNNDLTVIDGSSSSGGHMQPGEDPIGGYNTAESSGNLFDRNWATKGSRHYWSGQVQPYLPNPSVPVDYPNGGDGTKQNMNGRGYFNFRFFWTGDSDWGIGYLAIQKLQRRGTSSTKETVGPKIVLLDAKALTEAERISGLGQRRLGNIRNDENDSGSPKGEDRSFNAWRRNWLGLVDPATGWQLNVSGTTLNPDQPVYRSGKGHYPTDRDAPYSTDKSDKPLNREYGAHRAYNNPGRLYTTGVATNGSYTPQMGAGFEAGEYRVYLYKGYDSLHDNSKTSSYIEPDRQKKMYRHYEDSFDITIYPGVVTTAIYRAGLEKSDIKGAFAYTPIPQAAFGRLVVLNNPSSNDYTVNAILLDKPGYYNSVNASDISEVHRYIAAIASTPSSMTGGTPNLLNGNSWGTMNPLLKGQMHTFILPPGGYRIAVQSTRNRDSLRTWYGEGSGTWLPVVVTEGETVYLTYRGDELSR